MRLQKKYNQNTGMYEDYDPLTGAGIFDFISNIGSRVASDSAKKIASKAAEAALESGMKKVGDKAGEYVADKLFSKPAPMGELIVDELTKEKDKDWDLTWKKALAGSSISRNIRIKNLLNKKNISL